MKYIINIFSLLFVFSISYAEIINNFETDKKLVALTFDACETKTPAYFDKAILNYIISNKIPVTLFLSGKFIERNREDIKSLKGLPFIEIENHSYSHRDFRSLSEEEILNDIKKK